MCLPSSSSARRRRLPRKSGSIGREMSPRLTRISLVQQGVIAQNEFAKLLMMGSRGLIELAAPLTDEERRDFEIHIHGSYGSALAVQGKSVTGLGRLGKNGGRPDCQVTVRAAW